MTKYYFVLAVLIALLLSLLDFRYIISAKSRIIAEHRSQLSKMENIIDKLQAELQKQKDESSKKTDEIRKTKWQIAEVKGKSTKLINEEKTEKHIVELAKRADKFKERSEKLAADRKKFAMSRKEQELLQRKLARSQKEIGRQAELKKQYSKALTNIRKRKKEEEELLVVSSDGKSVHRPKCIAVRHLTKEKRKLIKNWKTAQKEGYVGCGLCKPHIKPVVIVKDKVKYKFVGSKGSDKAHKASCLLVKNISNKDREYFRTYRAAIKKKYTACRVCNPEQ